ncbi:hypothetical protein GCM10027444_18590 [Actinopolyspora lacussalsi]
MLIVAQHNGPRVRVLEVRVLGEIVFTDAAPPDRSSGAGLARASGTQFVSDGEGVWKPPARRQGRPVAAALRRALRPSRPGPPETGRLPSGYVSRPAEVVSGFEPGQFLRGEQA